MTRWLSLAAIAAAIAFLVVIYPRETQPAPSMVGSTVKVLVGTGHGSGVHIGGGYVLTAQHVVEEVKDGVVKIKHDDGSLGEATILWSNKDHDVALLRLKNSARVLSSDLTCRDPIEREVVYARGNPGILEFIETRGTVAGPVRKIGNWQKAVAVAMVVVPGMSGGGVFDEGGQVIGINVGATVVPLGMFGASLSGIGVIVPASAICELMGRSN